MLRKLETPTIKLQNNNNDFVSRGDWEDCKKGKLEIHNNNMSLQGLVRHTVHNGHYSNNISLLPKERIFNLSTIPLVIDPLINTIE